MRLEPPYLRLSVHVTAEQMASKPIAHAERPLQVERGARWQMTEAGNVERLRGNVGPELALPSLDHGEANAAHRDRLPERQLAQRVPHAQAKALGGRLTLL